MEVFALIVGASVLLLVIVGTWPRRSADRPGQPYGVIERFLARRGGLELDLLHGLPAPVVRHHLRVVWGAIFGPLVSAAIVGATARLVYDASLVATLAAAGAVFAVLAHLEGNVILTPTPQGLWARLRAMGPRMGVAITLSILVTFLGAEELTFAQITNEQVAKERLVSVRDYGNEIRAKAPENKDISTRKQEITRLTKEHEEVLKEIAPFQAEVGRLEGIVRSEFEGGLISGNGEGAGPEWERQRQALDAAKGRLEEQMVATAKERSAIDGRIDELRKEITGLRAAIEVRVTDGAETFRSAPGNPVERFVALNQATVSAGRWDLVALRAVIWLMLLSVELSGILAKFSRRTPYDAAIEEQEREALDRTIAEAATKRHAWELAEADRIDEINAVRNNRSIEVLLNEAMGELAPETVAAAATEAQDAIREQLAKELAQKIITASNTRMSETQMDALQAAIDRAVALFDHQERAMKHTGRLGDEAFRPFESGSSPEAADPNDEDDAA